jgi:O-antigen/teichoic acid export membrane protein
LYFSVCFGFVLIGAGLIIRQPVLNFFRINDASDAYILALFACAIQSVGAMVLSVFRGIQRMDKANSIEMKMLVVSGVGTVFFYGAVTGLWVWH